MSAERDAALSLLTAQAVRSRAQRLLAVGLEDRLPHFRIRLENLDAVADLVIATTRAAYPSLDVPFHSRWRHFVFRGEDRWASLSKRTTWKDPYARARAAFDLAIVSVLVDAGAGPQWRYRDAQSGERIGRSVAHNGGPDDSPQVFSRWGSEWAVSTAIPRAVSG